MHSSTALVESEPFDDATTPSRNARSVKASASFRRSVESDMLEGFRVVKRRRAASYNAGCRFKLETNAGGSMQMRGTCFPNSCSDGIDRPGVEGLNVRRAHAQRV